MSITRRESYTAERMSRCAAAKVNADYCVSNLNVLCVVLVGQIVRNDVSLRVVCERFIDNALCRRPLSEDIAVIVNSSRIFLFEVLNERRIKERIVIQRIRLLVYVSVRIKKRLEPMARVVGVASSVKYRIWLIKTRFQHIEHLGVPCCYLVTVTVFD